MKKIVLFLFFFSCLIPSEKKIPLVLSIPKAGGHLALEMLYLFPEVPDCQWADHLVHCGIRNPFIDDPHATKILIVRDLRDVFISLVHWFDQQVREGLIHRHVVSKKKGLRERIQHWRESSFDEKLRIVLDDGEENLYYDGFMRENLEEGFRLMQQEGVILVRFEELVGPQGGGDQKLQIQTILNVARSLGQNLTEKESEVVGEKMFGKSETFRKGKVGSWEGCYNEDHLLQFYLRYGRYQKAFGY